MPSPSESGHDDERRIDFGPPPFSLISSTASDQSSDMPNFNCSVFSSSNISVFPCPVSLHPIPSLSCKPIVEIAGLNSELVNKDSKQVFSLEIEYLGIPRGAFTSILGGTGSGKTTLLTILGLLRRPMTVNGKIGVKQFDYNTDSEGKFCQDVIRMWSDGPSIVADFRKRHVGFCLQSGELLPNLTVFENIAMPMILNGMSSNDVNNKVSDILVKLSESQSDYELLGKRNSLPRNLSGGQQQRVALARSIAHNPSIMFLDEPTGSLDKITAERAIKVAKDMMRASAIVMITHDSAIAREFSDFIIEMERPTSGKNGNTHRSCGRIRSYHRNSGNGQWCETNARWE